MVEDEGAGVADPGTVAGTAKSTGGSAGNRQAGERQPHLSGHIENTISRGKVAGIDDGFAGPGPDVETLHLDDRPARVTLDPAAMRIDVTYVDGPFKYLNNHWLFRQDAGGCMIDFYVDFEFRSRLLQKMMQPLFNEAVRRMVSAFEERAARLYG